MKINFAKGADFVLTVNRACDVSESQLAAYGVPSFSHRYEFDGETYFDSLEYESDHDCLSEAMLKGKKLDLLPSTQLDYELFFESILDAGARKIVHISSNSVLTDDFALATKAARMEMIKYPKSEVYVVDSRAFSNGLDIIIREGVRLRDEGVCAADASVRLTVYSRRVVTYFVPADSSNIQISQHYSTPPTGKLLDLRQMCVINTRGDVTIQKKFRGNAMVCSALSHRMLKRGGREAFVSYGLDPALPIQLKRRLYEIDPEAAFTLGRTGAFADWLMGGEGIVFSFVASPDSVEDDED